MKGSVRRLAGPSVLAPLAMLVGLTASQLAACGPDWTPPPVTAGPTPMSAHDAVRKLEKARALALAPTATDVDARAYAAAWQDLAAAPPPTPPGFELQPEGRRVLDALDAALLRVSSPAAKVSLQRSRAGVFSRLGNRPAAVGALRAALAAFPTTRPLDPELVGARLDVALTLVPLLGEAGTRSQVTQVCREVFPSLRAPDDRFALLDACYESSGAGSVEAGLAWAPPAQRRFYLARRTGGPVAPPPARRTARPQPTAAQDRALRDAMKRYRICQSRCRSLHSGCMDQACMGALTKCLDGCEARLQ